MTIITQRRRSRRLGFQWAAPWAAAVLLAALALPLPASGRELTVAAAASLQPALRELGAAYGARYGARPLLVFGASGSLAHQLEHGAPYDVFASADENWVRRLTEKSRIAKESVAVYATGTLALVVRDTAWLAGLPSLLRGEHLGLLRRVEIRVVALANPRHAPYGIAAQQALRHAGLWRALQPRLVYGENVRQTLTYLDTGNADAALVAVSLLKPGARRWRALAGSLYAPIRQAVGIASGTPRAAEARRFVAFLLSEAGRAILRRHGFGPPHAL